jgi:uncharacterized membrane protein YjgN (DUF898 family)
MDEGDHIDLEQYPERAQKSDDLIASAPVTAETEELPDLSLRFDGSAREYFRIWIVNLCLTILTLGIFSAWAKVRKKRYSYSRTTLGDTPFQYLGRPVPILKGRVIAAVGFLMYYISSHYVTYLMPYVLGAGLIVAPWVIVRSAAFNARYSAFRNMTFHFEGTYLGAMKMLYAWGIVPAFVLGMMFNWPGKPIVFAVTSIILSFSFPWLIRRLKGFIIEHTSYGGKKGIFFATGGQFFKIYLVAGLISMAAAIPFFVLISLFAFLKQSRFPAYIGVAPVYAGYVLMFAYIQSRSGNLVWNHTRLGPLRFRSTLRWGGLIKLYVMNALGIIVSLGLLIPWAVMRTVKYRIDHMEVIPEGGLDEFQGSDASAVTAVGAEMIDFFDVDLSL